MRKKQQCLGLVLLLLLAGCVRVEPPEEEIVPEVTTVPPLENVPDLSGSDTDVSPVVPNNQPQIEFDKGFTTVLQNYFEMKGDSSIPIQLRNASQNNVKVELGVNPLVSISLYNQSIFSVSAKYEYKEENIRVLYRFSNVSEEYQVDIIEPVSLSFQYERAKDLKHFKSTEDEELFLSSEVLPTIFANSWEAFEKERMENTLLQSETQKIIKEMMLSSYQVQDILITKEQIAKLQPLLIKSQVYAMPLSYIYNASTLWVMGDINLQIRINAENAISANYYAQMEVPIAYTLGGKEVERLLLLSCENGVYSLRLAENDSFYYSYFVDEERLLLNGREYFDEQEEVLFVEQALGVMQEFYHKYHEYNPKMKQLIADIEAVLMT